MSKIKAGDFITAWQNAETIDEVVESGFAKSRAQASVRAGLYRKKYEIALKRFPRGSSGARLDVEALKELAESLGGYGEVSEECGEEKPKKKSTKKSTKKA